MMMPVVLVIYIRPTGAGQRPPRFAGAGWVMEGVERSPGALVWDVGVAAACWSGQGTTVKWSRDKKGEMVEMVEMGRLARWEI